MKKIFAFALMFLCFLPSFVANRALAETTGLSYIVTANTANVYQSANLTSEVLYSVSHKDEVEIEKDSDFPKSYTGDGYTFYKIITTGKEGYILSDLVIRKNTSIQEIPNFNGRTNGKCSVYEKTETGYSKTSITLEKHQQIYLYEGYKSKKEYTAISFVYENEVVYGYIKTDYVDPNGINPIIITSICLVVAILGVAFTFVFIKGKKKKMS